MSTATEEEQKAPYRLSDKLFSGTGRLRAVLNHKGRAIAFCPTEEDAKMVLNACNDAEKNSRKELP